MNDEIQKKEFMEELNLFAKLAQRDLKKGFTIDQVCDELDRCSEAFYGSRLDFDPYALNKCSFVKTYLNQLVKGSIEEEYLEEYLNDINNSRKI